ncbi:MAG: hypothetical protein KJN68_05660 [Bacteroidia bacterium]|nr:hypothetical protein [Bacteroidia bacterium]
MGQNSIYVGDKKIQVEEKQVDGNLVNFDGEVYYKISNCDSLRSFFMSIVSDSNHWMFISSNGGLTAGRKDCDSALFPYYTDDKITESADVTGSKTIFQVYRGDKTILWEPFSNRYEGIYQITRNLYKNTFGNKIIFEEINDDLGLTFQYQWNSSNEFGFVKKSALINHSGSAMNLAVLDGIQNIVPYGIAADFQNSKSNLIDAYKKNELQAEVGLGIYALSAIIVDKAEPSEALKATIAWSVGMKSPKYLVSSLQLDTFRKGQPIKQETDIRAEKGAYFVNTEISLEHDKSKHWMIVANVNQSIISINSISQQIKKGVDLSSLVQKSIDEGTKQLIQLTSAADGTQLTADRLRNIRHFSNTMFNIMRGGIFDNNYQIEKADFVSYLRKANKDLSNKKESILTALPDSFNHHYLRTIIEQEQDPDFKRLAFEYLPLKFSRRHGDPSRPWNRFSINTTSEIDGSKILDYEGNWRDIFQNWEALAHAYPEFIDSMIFKFVNASTFDGYNPYRVTKDGIDWETIEEDDPWSYIGYWGDHQIIYLLKFLEFIELHYPGRLSDYYDQEIFVYANVPYKIKPYSDLLKNPKDTIDFDHSLDEEIDEKRKGIGADGALLCIEKQSIYHVTLIEKLLATVLAKLSNFIPEGGIWMNTQRPEWNDANNALVGNGVSMVTLCYLRRFLGFFLKQINTIEHNSIEVSSELVEFFKGVLLTLESHKNLLNGALNDEDRKTILDGLGIAGSEYRTLIYTKGFSNEKEQISRSDLLKFTKVCLQYLDHSIIANKRPDNLFHAYNLMTTDGDSRVSISRLSVMLEGQVAVLSSGLISGEASLELLNAMKASHLFRPDQYSYLLYPDKELPRFVEKNIIPDERVKESMLLQRLLKDANTQIIVKDVFGKHHFNGNFNNAESLKTALGELPDESYRSLIGKDYDLILEIFESIFDHKSFTGRSGTFYGYEGLGSIYWHMVSKLLLAVQENCLLSIENNESAIITGKLMEHYYEILEGIGVHKSPELYGAVPTDPYSHTPGGKGAQQPGMTGQVKEDILSRFGELGVMVQDGCINIKPNLLRSAEFLNEASIFTYTDMNHDIKEITLKEHSLAFTYCQVPFIYQFDDRDNLTVHMNDSAIKEFSGLSLNRDISSKVFSRSGEINKIVVSIEKHHVN